MNLKEKTIEKMNEKVQRSKGETKLKSGKVFNNYYEEKNYLGYIQKLQTCEIHSVKMLKVKL